MAKLNKWEQRHVRSIASIEKKVQELFANAMQQAATIGAGVNFAPNKPFTFDDYPLADAMMQKLQKKLKKYSVESLVPQISTSSLMLT